MNVNNISDAVDFPDSVLVKIIDSEKQLSALIHSKGLLNPRVKELYREIRASYESVILIDCQIHGHDIEYSLWKLHYKHIDEFRRKLRKSCATADHADGDFDSQKDHDNHLEAFKHFLAETTEYYVSLIMMIRQRSGVMEEPLFHKNDGFFHSIRAIKVDKYKFSCHSFLVRLGDLARYKEFYEKSDTQSCDWSSAASYYMEATKICPQIGNPHNQLAVLATYVGDDFLALYHFVRSLAVKEPFPDAWDNLVLLLEKNRDTALSSLCNEKTGLWSLFVRVISFFYIKSRFEDFNCALDSIIKEMETMMMLDDIYSRDTLDTYQHMKPTRTGPFRIIHMVSTLIFVIEGLIRRSSQPKEQIYINDLPLPVLTQLAWSATFALMARIVDGCAKCINAKNCCTLLPAVVIFSEWLVGVLDESEVYENDEENFSDISYFFGSFVDFLNFEGGEGLPTDSYVVVLWEDYELQGFEPLANVHKALDFSDNQECIYDFFESDSGYRMRRIFGAAIKMANTSRRWFLYDKKSRKFCLPDSNEYPEKTKSELFETVDSKSEIVEAVLTDSSTLGDEEEIILFDPISRSDPSQVDTVFTCTKSSCLESPILPGPPSLNAWVLKDTENDVLKNSLTRNESSSSSISLAPLLNPNAESVCGFNSSPNYMPPIPSAPLLPDDSVGYCGDDNSSKLSNYNSNLNINHGYSPMISNPSFERFQQYKHGENGGGDVKWPAVRHYYSNVLRNGPYPRLAGFDEWGNPLIYVETTELPMYRGLPVVYGADIKENPFHGFPIACGGGGGVLRMAEQRGEQQRRQLLQCLKEKNWEMQSEARHLGTST